LAALAVLAEVATVEEMREALLPAVRAPVIEVGERLHRPLPSRRQLVELFLGGLGQLPPMRAVVAFDAIHEMPRQQAPKQGVELLDCITPVGLGTRRPWRELRVLRAFHLAHLVTSTRVPRPDVSRPVSTLCSI
jgi:hypothetical protein